MTLQEMQTTLIPSIEAGLKQFLDTLSFAKSRGLKEMLRYHMGWNPAGEVEGARGKRIRPFLMLLCARGFDGSPGEALPGALAIEFLHNFTLIHDDIEDNSPIRHGRPTLWKKWGPAQAINAGDALFSIAQLSMLSLAPALGLEISQKAITRFNQMCFHLTQGQYLDIAFETETSVPIETYLAMIRGKTAALIAFSTELGGIVTNQPDAVLKNLTAYGENLGLAFQIQDDYLGVWGDPALTGKSAASDLMARKKTLPVLYGLANCPEFRDLWAEEEMTPEQARQAADLLENCGAQDAAKQQAARYTRQAFDSLKTLFLEDNPSGEALDELTRSLLNRKV